jgi:hypothetical protein
MKTLIINLALMVYSVALFAQQSAVDKLFDKYSGQEGFTTVYVSKYMFNLFAQIESNDEDFKDFEEVVSKLNSIKILASDDTQQPAGINFYHEIMKELPVEQYQELMRVKEKDQDMKFLIREEQGQIKELLLIVGGSDENVLISIQGNIDLETISKLSRTMNIEGMENLEKIEEKK